MLSMTKRSLAQDKEREEQEMNAKYMTLVARCPLLPITNKKEHSAAKKMIIELTMRDGGSFQGRNRLWEGSCAAYTSI